MSGLSQRWNGRLCYCRRKICLSASDLSSLSGTVGYTTSAVPSAIDRTDLRDLEHMHCILQRQHLPIGQAALQTTQRSKHARIGQCRTSSHSVRYAVTVQQRLISSCARKPHSAVQRTPSAPLWSFGLQLSAQCLLQFGRFCGGWRPVGQTSASKSRCRCLSNCNGTQQLSALSRSSAARPTHPTPPHTRDCRTARPAAHCSPNRNDPRGDIAAPGAERACSVSRVSD